ncbi:MAG: PAS domain S-box protein, partial [Proteobacteria bacterium]|nr:PAS domain S-box protein [Pseudomonadota bacterium]
MKDPSRTNQELTKEVSALKQQIIKLEQSESGHKKAEDELRRSEDKYRTLVETTGTGFVIIDKDGLVLDANLEYVRLTGHHDLSEIVGRSVIEWTADSEKGKNSAAIKATLEKGYTRNLEIDYVDSKGNITPIEINATSMEIEGKIQTITICRDITERKRVEEELLESESKFRALAESSSSAIFLIQGTKYIYINPAFESIIGYTMEDLADMNFWDFTHPDMRELIRSRGLDRISRGIDRISRGIDRIKGQDPPSRYEIKFIAKNGQVKWVDYSATVVELNNKPTIMGSTFDITERKRAEEELLESEERFRAFMDNMPGMVIIKDKESRPLFFNQKFSNMFPANEWLGKIPEETFPSEIAGSMRENDLKALSEGFVSYEEEWHDKNDCLRVLETRKFSINQKNKAPVLGVIITDITSRKQAEEEKRILQERLQHADKMEAIGTLAGGIAHDFNNLLMGIQGYASLALLELDPSHPNYERLKRIEAQVQSGADLTRQLLGFARGGRYEVKTADMNDILEKSSSMFGRTKKEITIHRKYAKDLFTVEVDRGQMEQVFMNLYVNAWQAMRGGGEIYLETENVLLNDEQAFPYAVKPGNYIRISMTDTGTGMDEKTRERIFDPFFTTKEMGRGTGLGLATVYGIIKGHNGFINVDSSPGHGTT